MVLFSSGWGHWKWGLGVGWSLRGVWPKILTCLPKKKKAPSWCKANLSWSKATKFYSIFQDAFLVLILSLQAFDYAHECVMMCACMCTSGQAFSRRLGAFKIQSGLRNALTISYTYSHQNTKNYDTQRLVKAYNDACTGAKDIGEVLNKFDILDGSEVTGRQGNQRVQECKLITDMNDIYQVRWAQMPMTISFTICVLLLKKIYLPLHNTATPCTGYQLTMYIALTLFVHHADPLNHTEEHYHSLCKHLFHKHRRA